MTPTIAPYPSSWFTDFEPDSPLGVVAASVLSGRFVAVLRHFPLAVTRAGDDVEHIHHLRVAARRCSAALAAFGKILPHKLRDQAEEMVRSVGRSAGMARDWDVFLIGIGTGKKTGKTSPKGSELLEGLALAHRVKAQKDLAEACPDFGQLFPKMMEKVAESASQSARSRSPVSSLADSVLNEALCDFRDEMSHGDKLQAETFAPKSGLEHLHRVRILGKRLRYLMEIFWRCLPREVRHDLYPLVEEAQEVLGQVNDHTRALAMMGQLSDEVLRVSTPFQGRLVPRLRILTRFHETQIGIKCRAYQRWRHRWEKVSGKWDKD